MERSTETAELIHSLASEHISVTQDPAESPSNVNAAGQDDIILAVRPDRQRANAFWLWAAADNLRLSALNAAECAQIVAAARPKGKVQ